MLDALARSDDDLVFLGDIFDLWVALPRYENELHRQFLAWCCRQKRHRSIGFMEGNHEFFLAANHADAFSWCSPGPWHLDHEGLLFCHGDQINRHDFRYLTFRRFSKNRIVQLCLRGLPLGPSLVEHLKRRLKHTNTAYRHRLPVSQIEAFAKARFRDGIQTVFTGHFHQAYTCRTPRGLQLFCLPAWFDSGRVSHYSPRDQRIVSLALG